MEVLREVEVDRDPAAVWEVLRDPSLMPEWFEKLENYVAVVGDGMSAGDRYKVDYRRDSGPIELSVEVLAVDAPDSHVHRFEGLPVAFTITSDLTETGDGTRWTATIEVKLSLMQRALGPVIKGYLDDLAGDMAEGFKAYVESR